MIMPFCANGGEDDLFEPYPWDFESYAQYCEDKYGIKPTTDLVEKIYGGKNLKSASNIIFRYNVLVFFKEFVRVQMLYVIVGCP